MGSDSLLAVTSENSIPWRLPPQSPGEEAALPAPQYLFPGFPAFLFPHCKGLLCKQYFLYVNSKAKATVHRRTRVGARNPHLTTSDPLAPLSRVTGIPSLKGCSKAPKAPSNQSKGPASKVQESDLGLKNFQRSHESACPASSSRWTNGFWGHHF